MEKRIKKLALLALLPVAGLAGVVTYASVNAEAPLTIKAENKDYKLSFGKDDFKGVLKSGSKNSYEKYVATLKTELGNEVEFESKGEKIITSSLQDDEIFIVKGQGSIYNSTAISGIKKIAFKLASRGYENCSIDLKFGFDKDNLSQSYRYLTKKNGEYEVTFDKVTPSYFNLELGGQTYFSKLEITYSCAEQTNNLGSITVNNASELKQALAYHSHFNSNSSIVLGSDIGLVDYLKFQGENSPKVFNIDLNGHVIKGLKKSEDASSIFDDARNEDSPAAINSKALIKIRSNANVIISGSGSILSNGTDTFVAEMGDSIYETTSSSLTINDGNFVSGFDTNCLYINAENVTSHKAGNIVINGGTFSNEGGGRNMLLNITDSTVEGTFMVNGGSFYDFNPANGDYGHSDTSSDNKKTYVDEFHEVSSTVDGTHTIYTVDKKSGEISLTSDITLSSKLTYANSNEEVAINGNGKTINVTSDFGNNNNVLLNARSNLTINDLTIDMANAAGLWGIQALGDITLNNVNIINVDHANKYLFTLNIYGGGNAKFVDCNIAAAKNMCNEDYGCADIWFGDGRNAIIQGGNYGSIFVNSSEGSGLLHAGKLVIESSSDHVTKIDSVTLEGEINNKNKLVYGGTTYEKKTAYMSAILEGNDSSYCTVTKVIENPQNKDLTQYTDLTGKTVSKAA